MSFKTLQLSLFHLKNIFKQRKLRVCSAVALNYLLILGFLYFFMDSSNQKQIKDIPGLNIKRTSIYGRDDIGTINSFFVCGRNSSKKIAIVALKPEQLKMQAYLKKLLIQPLFRKPSILYFASVEEMEDFANSKQEEFDSAIEFNYLDGKFDLTFNIEFSEICFAWESTLSTLYPFPTEVSENSSKIKVYKGALKFLTNYLIETEGKATTEEKRNMFVTTFVKSSPNFSILPDSEVTMLSLLLTVSLLIQIIPFSMEITTLSTQGAKDILYSFNISVNEYAFSWLIAGQIYMFMMYILLLPVIHIKFLNNLPFFFSLVPTVLIQANLASFILFISSCTTKDSVTWLLSLLLVLFACLFNVIISSYIQVYTVIEILLMIVFPYIPIKNIFMNVIQANVPS